LTELNHAKFGENIDNHQRSPTLFYIADMFLSFETRAIEIENRGFLPRCIECRAV